jgi:hypothetical protein
MLMSSKSRWVSLIACGVVEKLKHVYALSAYSTITERHLCHLQASPEDHVSNLKANLEGVSGILPEEQVLIYNGRELQST